MAEDLLCCGWLLSHTNTMIYFYFLFTQYVILVWLGTSEIDTFFLKTGQN